MQNKDSEVFGMLVRAARETKGFTFEQFAAAIQQTGARVIELGNGKVLLDDPSSQQMTSTLNVPRAYFEPVALAESARG